MTGEGLRKRRRPDPSLPRITVEDTSISFRALGALLWIMDKADGWSIRADHMAKDGKRTDGNNKDGRKHRREGREAIRTALLEELAAEGYYRLERRRMLDGSVKMGTAASEDRVESWANQYRIFGRNAVPVVQQRDGTFLVLYPDGTLGPDDCDPPEMLPPAGDVELSDESDAGPEDEPKADETAGGTGVQKPVSGPPVSRNPAPVDPASGEPASGNPSPLGVKEERGFKKEEPPPTPIDDATAADPADAATRGGDLLSEEENNQLLWAARDKVLKLRTDWKLRTVQRAMDDAVKDGRRPEDVALAIVVAAEDRATQWPSRIGNDLWWQDNMIQRIAALPPANPCTKQPGHVAYSANNCAACKVENMLEAAEKTAPERAAAEEAAFVRMMAARQGNAAQAARDAAAFAAANLNQEALLSSRRQAMEKAREQVQEGLQRDATAFRA